METKSQQSWVISVVEFSKLFKQAIRENNTMQIDHLLNDFWFGDYDGYMVLKSDVVGEVQ